MTHRRFFLFALAMASGIASWGNAGAQAYPARTIKLITGYGPGGSSSPINRKFAEELSRQLKQPVIVEDKPGAGNSIGARLAMAAPPDGYTLHIGGLNPHPLIQVGGVDLGKEMEPVGIIGEVPLLFVTSAASPKPLKTVADIVAYARANPGAMNFASSGGGGHWNMKMGLFANRVGGIDYTHVPYKGGSDVQIAITRGDAQITLLTAGSARPLVESGKGYAVMMAASQRAANMPEVPTPAELGLKSVTASTLFVLWAPRGTPHDIIAKLNGAMQAIARDPAHIEWMRERAGNAPPVVTPEQTRDYYEAQVRELEEAARITGLKPG